MTADDKQTYCVSIFADRENGRRTVIYYVEPKHCAKLHTARYALLYTRVFNNVVDALGHKLLLERLSANSLDAFIRKYNSSNEDSFPYETNSPIKIIPN